MPEFKRVGKSLNEITEENYDINIVIAEDDYLQIEYTKKGGDADTYLVSMIEDLWRCNCPDYLYRGVTDEGSFICKHIYHAITTLVIGIKIIDYTKENKNGND